MNFRILYIGPLNKNGTCYQRLIAFEKIFKDVIKIDTYVYKNKPLYYFLNAFLNKFNIWFDFLGTNKEIRNIKEQIDIVWIDKGLTISKKTIDFLKKYNVKFCIHYSPDDMFNIRNQSKKYLECIHKYDLHVTTKSYNIKELLDAGAQKAIFINNCFDDYFHVKINNNQKKYDIGFIGSFEIERAKILLSLASKGYSLTIRGNWPIQWVKKLNEFNNVNILPIELAFPEYNLFISNCKINLCFLRKVNRDLQTTRSIEIPAMGGFMLAEDTIEHRLLFNIGFEAEFFINQSELESKIDYFLKNEIKREEIALNGYKRTRVSGYSNFETFSNLFKNIIHK